MSCSRTEQEEVNVQVLEHIRSLQEHENFFKLKTYFEHHKKDLSEKDYLYFKAIVETSFNNHQKSIEAINRLLRKHHEELSDYELMFMHKTLYINFYNQFIYKKALEECNILLDNFKDVMDSVKYAQMEGDRKLLEALKDSPPQMVEKFADSNVDIYRDNMGLLNVLLEMHGDTLNFLFDTGTSFSFLRRSIAEKHGLAIYDVDFEVEGATGNSVYCDIAVVDEFYFGDVLLKNAVFWVFDDPDLTIPEIPYSVNGAIGFPIIRSMEEIHIIFDDTIFIPKKAAKYDLYNLAMDDLDPVIAVIQDKDTLPYYLDTGSAFTSLYHPFYTEHEEKIKSEYQQQTYSMGGLGGMQEFTSYIADSIEIQLGENAAWIYDVEVLADPIYKDAEKVYGNLGQDFILQFHKMIISSKYSSAFLK